LRKLGEANWPIHLIRDRAYEGDETRQPALELNFIPVVRPRKIGSIPGNTTALCTSDATRSSDYSAVSRASVASFPGSKNLTVIFIAFIHFALTVEALRQC